MTNAATPSGVQWWRRIGAFAVYLAGSLCLLELALRIVFPIPEVLGFERLTYAGKLAAHLDRPAPSLAHHTLWWWSEPDGASHTSALNLHGFRGPQWPLAKREGWPRWAFVGDSFVEGLGAGDAETLVVQFALAADRQDRKVETLNWGAGGFGLGNYARLLADAVPLFEPDVVMLVLYMNDLYQIPDAAKVLRPTIEPRYPSPWRPRLLHVLEGRSKTRPVVRRWRENPGDEPKPMNVQPRFAADPNLLRNVERHVDPELSRAMKAGRLNPATSNLLHRSERVLPQPVDMTAYLGGLQVWLAERRVQLRVAYIPSLNQVSDAYRPAQDRISASISSPSLTAERFQQHARDLTHACRQADIPFLDLTPKLRRAESEGQRLYWAYDGHMTAAGYRQVGEALFSWWALDGG